MRKIHNKPYMSNDENPRWTLCRMDLGREPKGYEFMIWNSEHWYKFFKTFNFKLHQMNTPFDVLSRRLGVDEAQDAYDEWLYDTIVKKQRDKK